MIHKTRVRVSFPGIKWAERMQEKRNTTAYDPSSDKQVMFEGIPVDAGVVYCEKGSIRLSSTSGQVLDYTRSDDFEFVKYDGGLIILALHVGEGKASYDFDKLFSSIGKSRPSEPERAFLIVPAKNAKNVIAWALMPMGKDAHSDVGVSATPEYLDRLMREARG